MWIGLKNSDDVGTKFDLLAEVLKNGSVVGSGQLNNVPGGSSGFNNAVLRTISVALSTPVGISPGDTLSIRLSVRIAVGVSGHRSGTARLWFNDDAANSRFNATIAGAASDFFLGTDLGWLDAAGPGPKKTIDVFVDRRLVLLTMVLSILVAAALVAMAASVVTTDPNSFQTQITGLGTPTVIDFEDIDASPVNNGAAQRAQFNGGFYAAQGITFSNPNGDPLYIAPGGLFWNASNSLSVSNFPFESGSDTNDDLVVTFSAPVIAAGFTFVDNGSQNPDEFVQFS